MFGDFVDHIYPIEFEINDIAQIRLGLLCTLICTSELTMSAD